MKHHRALRLPRITLPAFALIYAALGCGTNEAAASGLLDDPETAKQQNEMPTSQQQATGFPPFEISLIERKRPTDFDGVRAVAGEIRELFDYSNLPEPLAAPANREVAYEFVKAFHFLEQQRIADLEFLESFRSAELYPDNPTMAQNCEGARTQIVGRLSQYLVGELEAKVDNSRAQVGGVVEGRWFLIQKAAEVDMEDSNQVRNVLCNELLTASREKAIAEALDHADIMVLFDDALGIESDWVQKREELAALVTKYRSNLDRAVDSIQPPADIGDEQLRDIAAEVLARKTYKLPEHVRLIVNAPKREETSTEYTIDWDESTITKGRRTWYEFQAATIEAEGDGFALFYNTLIYYTEGPTTVLKDKWLLGPRHRSSAIAEANIGI